MAEVGGAISQAHVASDEGGEGRAVHDEELTIIPAVCSGRTSLTIHSRQVQWLVFDVFKWFDRVARGMKALVKLALAGGAGLDLVEVGLVDGGLVGGALPFTRKVLLRRGSRLIARGGRPYLPHRRIGGQ